MSAVRSVSCNSSMSKCNKTEVDDEEYGPGSEGPPLIDSMYVKQTGGDCPPPPPPPSGTNLSCSNPDLVQVTVTRERERESQIDVVQDTKLWDRPPHKDSYRPLNGSLTSSYAPHQYFPPRVMYNHPFLPPGPRLQFLQANSYRGGAPHQPPHQAFLGPPQYRHPPPVQIHAQHTDIEVSLQ